MSAGRTRFPKLKHAVLNTSSDEDDQPDPKRPRTSQLSHGGDEEAPPGSQTNLGDAPRTDVVDSDEELAADLVRMEEEAESRENLQQSSQGATESSENPVSGVSLSQPRSEYTEIDGVQNVSSTTADDAVRLDKLFRDDDCPEYLREGFKRTHKNLCNLGVYKFELTEEFVEDEFSLLTVAPHHEVTMDFASKCFRLIPGADLRRMTQPHEGYHLCYMDRCKGVNLSPHALKVIFFYSELMKLIKLNGMTNYAIPLTFQSLKRSKKRDSNVLGICESITGGEPVYDGLPEVNTDLISIVKVLNDREAQKSSELKLERDPFTIRVAFTGATYNTVNTQERSDPDSVTAKRDLFCVVVITPNAGFDLQSYVKDFFYAPPRSPMFKEQWLELQMAYKNIQRFEANHNCGLFCDPSKYDNDVGGTGGVFSLLTMLNLPYRVAHVLQSLYPKHVMIEGLNVIGFPKLSYSTDGSMKCYEKYMHRSINHAAENHETFLHHSKVFYSANDADQGDLAFELPSPGGWPLKSVRDAENNQVFIQFGLFKFPMLMEYKSEIEQVMDFESFTLNMGSLPVGVEIKNRNFKTFNSSAENKGIIPDDQLLTSTELATPLQILTTFYGPNARPADDFLDSKLLKWFHSMDKHLQDLLGKGEITAEEALVQVHTHMENCVEQHRCIMDNDGYGSQHLQQCRRVARDVDKTRLNEISSKTTYETMLSENVPENIRHDAFLSSSYILLNTIVNWNEDARLNSTNLETALDIQISSIAWILDSHHFSLIPFFQGCLIMNNRGHNMILLEKQFFMDWRKPNSSGAGAIQERLNKYFEQVGLCYNIMKGRDNKLVYVNTNRLTDGAIEGETCIVTVMNGGIPEVQSKPSAELKHQPLLQLEVRGNAPMDNVIRLVFPRDAAARNMIATTVDPKNTNERKTAIKEQVVNPAVCGWSTNQTRRTEEPKTIACVTHACLPGAPSYKKLEDQRGEFNNVKCELNDGRAKMPSGGRLDLMLKQIFFSHAFAKSEVAMLHKAGAYPYAINSVVTCALDWMYMVLKEHLFCMFNPLMMENFGRIRVSACEQLCPCFAVL